MLRKGALELMAQTVTDIAEALSDLAESLQSKRRPTGMLAERLKEHFGDDLGRLAIVGMTFSPHELPSVHLALEHHVKQQERQCELIGVSTSMHQPSLSDLLLDQRTSRRIDYMVEGPVQYNNVEIARGQTLLCVQRGLFLLQDKGRPFAILLNQDSEYLERVQLECMAADRQYIEQFFAEIKRLIVTMGIYKGQVFTFRNGRDGKGIYFQDVPTVRREQIILPDTVLERVERNTVRFSKYRDVMVAKGLHVSRGVLLHGAPGTGKSLLVAYLIGQMPGRTTILLNGSSLDCLSRACSLARQLQPSTIVIEDVDLIAEERSESSHNQVLIDLLNELDGLRGDADVLFLLTTNRPEVLEPALASRPGRVDQAIRIPLPDESCRKRLFELYSRGLTLQLKDEQRIIRKTKGTCAAFMKELLRKATLHALEDDSENAIEDRHVESALAELLDNDCGGAKNLLGFQPVASG